MNLIDRLGALTGPDSRPYAHCCNAPVEICDCVTSDHGTAVFKSICNIPNCRKYAPATEAFCSQHRAKGI